MKTSKLHRPVAMEFQKRNILKTAMDNNWGVDFVVVQLNSSKSNIGVTFLLNVTVNCSKYTWGVPSKDETSGPIVKVFENLLRKKRRTNIQWVDKGVAFCIKTIEFRLLK